MHVTPLMKRAFAAGLLLLTLGLADTSAQRARDLVNHTTAGRVVKVIDGDTVDVALASKRTIRVRLHGVDSPESGEPFSQQARTFTRVLLFSQQVTVEGRDVDQYGRLVARVRVGQTDSSLALLEAGLACHYRQFSSDPVLEAGERSARTSGRGFWLPAAPKPQCVAREAAGASRRPQAAAVESGFVGNVSSHVYHAPTCRNARCRNCTRRFASREEAASAGFRPAGDCLKR
jgi:endonuclease YncB( thermonuclease family)